jgi:hypothetical protein
MKNYGKLTHAELAKIPLPELTDVSNFYHNLKCWCASQRAVDNEIASRAQMIRNSEDVQGIGDRYYD